MDWQDAAHIYLFDRASGSLLRRLSGLPNVINHMAFSPDGAWLAAGLGGKNGIRLWRTDTWELAGEDRDYGDSVYGLDFRPDSSRLTASSDDGDLRLYRVGEGLKRLTRTHAPGGQRPNQS